MKSGSDLKQASDPSLYFGVPFRWPRDTCQYLQQGALAGPVSSNQPNHLALLHLKRNVPQCPKNRILVLGAPAKGSLDRVRQSISQRSGSLQFSDMESLAQLLNLYYRLTHPPIPSRHPKYRPFETSVRPS